jgi:copper(I)-binding protein
MLRTTIDSLHSHRAPGQAASTLVRTGVAGLIVAVGAALAGCTQEAAASGPTIELGTAYIGQPQGTNPTDAYLVIRNKGPADKLVSAKTSVGGAVTLRGPGRGGPAAMRNVAAITVPAHELIRLDPNGYHLVVTGARPMKAGTEITLTLTFAKAGSYKIAAEVTNAQTGGNSYFLN